jgi:hypothetical protein
MGREVHPLHSQKATNHITSLLIENRIKNSEATVNMLSDAIKTSAFFLPSLKTQLIPNNFTITRLTCLLYGFITLVKCSQNLMTKFHIMQILQVFSTRRSFY